MASTLITPIQIPERVRPLLGNPTAGTRMYRRDGGRGEFEAWFDAVCEACGPDGAISPGAAGIYAQVSRAGVHKRMKEGGLTAFLFHLDRTPGSGSTGNETVDTGRPYTLIPVRECKAWGQLLRARRRGDKGGQTRARPDRRVAETDRDSWRQW
jgi:hypothetical protein